jgi:hypothetical protein
MIGTLVERLVIFLLRATVRVLLVALSWLWRHTVVEWFRFPDER